MCHHLVNIFCSEYTWALDVGVEVQAAGPLLSGHPGLWRQEEVEAPGPAQVWRLELQRPEGGACGADHGVAGGRRGVARRHHGEARHRADGHHGVPRPRAAAGGTAAAVDVHHRWATGDCRRREHDQVLRGLHFLGAGALEVRAGSVQRGGGTVDHLGAAGNGYASSPGVRCRGLLPAKWAASAILVGGVLHGTAAVLRTELPGGGGGRGPGRFQRSHGAGVEGREERCDGTLVSPPL
eukprot:SAG22_NODE_71_length_22540_cov_8.918052_4_plen_238_part_00